MMNHLPVQSKLEMFNRLRQHQAAIRAFGVARLGLFGSFKRDDQDEDSDVDFIVEFEGNQKTFDNFMQLCFFLEELLNRPVELVTPDSLSPYIGPRILAETEYVTFNN
jgi:uncharacterized protein